MNFRFRSIVTFTYPVIDSLSAKAEILFKYLCLVNYEINQGDDHENGGDGNCSRIENIFEGFIRHFNFSF